MRDILALGKSIADTQAFFEAQYERTKALRKSIAHLSEIKTLAERFQSALIQPGDELNVITALESLAGVHHITQDLTIDFVDAKDPIGLPAITFSMSNRGAFTDQINYLRALEQLPYYVIIDRLEWSKSTDAKSRDKSAITLRFTATVYQKNSQPQ